MKTCLKKTPQKSCAVPKNRNKNIFARIDPVPVDCLLWKAMKIRIYKGYRQLLILKLFLKKIGLIELTPILLLYSLLLLYISFLDLGLHAVNLALW